jgi:hypothetical protein
LKYGETNGETQVEAAVDLAESFPDIIEAIETKYGVTLLYLQFYL